MQITEKDVQEKLEKKIEQQTNYSRYLNGYIERLDQKIMDTAKNLDRTGAMVMKIAGQLQRLLRKTNNGWGDMLARHEKELDEKISREEFNSAMASLRAENKKAFEGIEGQISTLKWVFGLGFLFIGSLIAAGYFIA